MTPSAFAVLALLPALASAQCVGLWGAMFDNWCNDNCFASTPFCPESFCRCAPPPPAQPPATIGGHVLGACSSQTYMYILESTKLTRMRFNGNTYETEEPFVGASDIEIDSDQNIIVADPGAGALYVVPAGCGEKKAITSWSIDQIIGNPTAIAISDGSLLVSGHSRVLRLVVSAEYDLLSWTITSITTNEVSSMDTAPDGRVFFVERGASVKVYDPQTGSVTTVFTAQEYGMPDIKGIKVTICGMYISVPDSSEVWKCTDYKGDTCRKICVVGDDNSCLRLHEPHGVTVDSNCTVYIASRANGKMLVAGSDGSIFSIAEGLFHPVDVELFAPDECAYEPPEVTPNPDGTGVYEHIPGCCGSPVWMYFVDLTTLYRVQLDHITHEPLSAATPCANFLGPSDIEIDEDQNVIVADPVAGTVFVVPPSCGPKRVITQWPTDQIVDHPTALALAQGGIFVSGSSRIFFLEVDENYGLVSSTQTDITTHGVDSMDTAPDGTLFFLESGASILTYNPTTGAVGTYTTVHEHGIPDMKGIRISECGLYISVTDSNQIWHCDDLTDSSSCEMFCVQDTNNLDASSCVGLNNPYGLTVDCNCTVFTASRGNGRVVASNPDGASSPVVTGLNHPTDVEIFSSRECLPTPSNTRTPMPTPSPTATATASRSRSPSPTPSPLWEQFLLILDFNTACSAGTCDGVNQTQIDSYPASSRAFSMQHSIRYHVASDAFDPNTGVYCDVQVQYTGTSLNYRCTRSVDPFDYIGFDPAVFQMFVAVEDSGNGLPPYIVGVDRFPADTYPNALLKPAVSGLINCIGYNDVSFRIAVQSPRPSWDDDVFGVLTMLDRGSLGTAPGLTNYVDADGNNAEPLSPYKEFVCVQDV